jgi:hypothetical protein
MTKRSTSGDSPNQLLDAGLDELMREMEVIYGRVIEEVASRGDILWPELKPSKFAPLEVHQAALQQHLANGGDPKDNPSPLTINRAVKALEATSAHIKYQTVCALLDARLGGDVGRLLPLLTAKEQAEHQITFARAVMITTGNHDHKNERPGRWIPIFQAKAAKCGEETFKWLMGSLTAANLKKIQISRGKDFNTYAKYGPDDFLSLNEFSRMFTLFAPEFPRGRELTKRLGDSALDRFAAERARALKRAKKVLGPVSGQPKKSTPRKPKKRRTKTA